jgi:hypothetical protein
MGLDGNSTCHNTAHKGSAWYPGELKPPLLAFERSVLTTVLATDPCTRIQSRPKQNLKSRCGGLCVSSWSVLHLVSGKLLPDVPFRFA